MQSLHFGWFALNAFAPIHASAGLKWGRILFENYIKNGKTKTVVWDAIWIAWNPENKFWTAEIEIYPLVTSNGPPGYEKNCKTACPFSDLGPLWHRHIVDSPNFDVLMSRKALKARISSPKINFGSKFCQKCNSDNFGIFKNLYQIFYAFLFFSHFSDFAQKWKFWWFSIIFVKFLS